LITFNDVSKTYDGGNTFVVKDLTWQIEQGEFFVIMGSSGSGKSTAIKMINRLIEPSSGSITMSGQCLLDLPPIQLRRSIGYVFQKIGLFPHMTVADNIHVVLRIHHKVSKQTNQRIDELLTLVNLDPAVYRDRFPRELSGGQQQRVGIARALAIDADLILMDEPFSALDAITRTAMQIEIRQLQKQLGKTVVFVTHDLFEAFQMADRIAIMDGGVLQQIGLPQEILKHPETKFVSQLMQSFKNQILTYYPHLQSL
jgi:osmoprotectant transport system ATP-binding protein